MTSNTPDIIPFASPFGGNLLTVAQIDTLRDGTLRLLDEVGVHVPSEKALAVFADCGARVDPDAQIVRIPPDVVERALATAPRSFVLAGREERFDLRLDGSAAYLCTDGCGVHVIDLETRQQRASRSDDVARMARICDALPLVSFFWPLVSAQDHPLTAPLYECHAGLMNTKKHVRGGTTVRVELAPYIVEMATVAAGSDEARRQRPPICANICTIAPLAHDKHGIETALVYAEAGLPTSFMSMPTMGSTAPATPLGALVQADAEVVSALVLMQLAHPGAPVFHSIIGSLMEPRTGGYIADPPVPLNLIAVQLAHAWGVPALGGGSVGGSDALVPGWHAASEGGLGAALIPLAGAEICGFLGMLDATMILYPEQIILDYEIIQNAYDLLHAFNFKEEDMALDVIAEVGPSSHYLKQKHTRQHIRDFRLSKITRQTGPDGQPQTPEATALAEFHRINREHQPEPLPDAILAEFDRILAAADREAERLAG